MATTAAEEGTADAGSWRLAELALLFLAERERWVLWVPVLAGCGVGLYFALTVEPPLAAGVVAVLAGLLALALARRHHATLIAATALSALAAGFLAAQLATWRSEAPIIERKLGPARIAGRVLEVDHVPGGRRLLIAPTAIPGLSPDRLPARIRVRIADSLGEATPGAAIAVRAILLPPPAPAMPGAFDFQRQAFFERIGGVGFAVGPVALTTAPAGSGWSVAVAALRNSMTERILAALPGPAGAVAAALITGERGPIPEAVNEAFRDSGLAHLLSISGIHMSLVAGIAFWSVRALIALLPPLALRIAGKKWAAAAALVAIAFYTLLSGATVPAQRSFLMAGLALLAIMVDRLEISMRVVAWAALALVLVSPESVVGASFQMSFAAVVALVAFYETFQPRLAEWRVDAGWLRRLGMGLALVALTSLVATAATGPFAAYHFNRFAAYSLAANVIAVPITGVWIMPWAMVACLMMPLGLEAWPLIAMGWGVEAVIATAAWVADWPGAELPVPAMPLAGIVVFALGGLWLCIWQGRWRRWGLVPMVGGLASILIGAPPDILIAAEGGQMAVRAADGDYHVAVARRRALVEENWFRRAGAERGEVWPRAGATADGRLVCDPRGCLYRAGDRTIAFARSRDALDEDCRSADLVVSLGSVRRGCRRVSRVIDAVDLWRDGAHAIWLERGAMRIETVNGTRGVRPWVPRRRTGREEPGTAPPDDPAQVTRGERGG